MKIVLKALNGLMKSKVIEVDFSLPATLYFAHLNKFDIYFDKASDVPKDIDIKKLTFEPTGKVFRDKKKKPIYEYELTEI